MPQFVSPHPTPEGVAYEEILRDDVATEGLGPSERVDPFWSMVWSDSNGGPTIGWRSRRADELLIEADVPYEPPHRRLTRDATEALEILGRRRSRVTTLATINLWRTITSEQLAAMQARPALNTYRSDDIGLLYDAGLIQRGRFFYDGVPLAGYPEVFRPDPALADADLSGLSYVDWLGVTLGSPPVRGHQYDRHNILMTELSLRVAEMCPIHTVLGEHAASWTRIFQPHLNPNPHRVADSVWVREDGLRIAVEMTATVTSATTAKIEQIAELLARDTTKSVVVLFVVGAARSKSNSADVAHQLRGAVKKSAHSSMKRILADVEERMLIARWEDWFPGPGLASYEFVRLRARKFAAQHDEWVDVDLLDPFDVPFEYGATPEVAETLANLGYVLGTPHWMQRGSPRHFDNYIIRAAGFTRG